MFSYTLQSTKTFDNKVFVPIFCKNYHWIRQNGRRRTNGLQRCFTHSRQCLLPHLFIEKEGWDSSKIINGRGGGSSFSFIFVRSIY